MIVLPAGGESSRFRKEGIDTPKFMLPLGRKSVFQRVVGRMGKYTRTEDFLVIARDDPEHINFLKTELHTANVASFDVVAIPQLSRGMMDSVCQGLERTRFDLRQHIYIQPIDVIRDGMILPNPKSKALLVDFEWNASEPLSRRIKGLGSYSFACAQLFLQTYKRSQQHWLRDRHGEKAMEIVEAIGFIARLTMMGYKVRPRLDRTGNIIHVGTPKRYRMAKAAFE